MPLIGKRQKTLAQLPTKFLIFDQSCSTEVYSKEVKNALTHTVPLNSLNVASTYCLKIEARDLPGNRTKASNNSLLFKTAAPHTLNAGADIVVKERTTLSAAASSETTSATTGLQQLAYSLVILAF